MATDSFDGFDVDVSAHQVVFSDSTGPPRWVIDTALLAGQPSLSAKRTRSTRSAVQITTLTITLTGSRYPGTQLVGDLTISIREIDGDGGTTTIVHLTLSFGNAAFNWDAAGFVNWLTGVAPATMQILPAGAVAALGSGGAINFGPATTGI